VIDPLKFRLEFSQFNFNEIFSFNTGLHVIYGESSTGKSALINQLLGYFSSSVNFKATLISSPHSIQKVFQNPDTQIVSSSVFGELAFSLECQSRNTPEILQQISKLKRELIFSSSDRRHPETLSGGEKESLNLTTAFSVQSGCVLIDDGLSFLNEKSKEKMLTLIREKIELTQCIVVWMTSDITDLKKGDTSWELTLSSLKKWDGIVKPLPEIRRIVNGKNLNFRAKQLSFSYGNELQVFDSYSFQISDFSALGILGSNGSGKSTLAKLILGIEKPSYGEISILFEDQPLSVAYLEQFPEKMIGPDSLNHFIDKLICSGKLNHLKVNYSINHLKRCHIEWSQVKDKTALDLSWSTLRFILTIWLLNCEYDLLVLDEPTFGLGRRQVIKLFHYLQLYLKNKHLIIISHDNQFIHSFCDQILDIDQHQHFSTPLTQYHHGKT